MKALIAGLGSVGQRHARNLRTLIGSEVELIAYRVRKRSDILTDRLEIEAGSNLEEKYNIKVYSDLGEALAQGPDVAIVSNPSRLHIPVALAAAKSGCHLFIEKPLSHNLENVQELIDLVETKGLVSFVGYQMRFHPFLKHVRSLLQQGAIGPLLAARVEVGEYLPGWHTYEDYREMYASRKELGGGVILSQIHEMDYIYWLFGLPQRLFALGGHLSSLEIDVEDIASVLMEYRFGGRSFPVHLHQDYIQRPPSRTCQIIGDEGKIIVDLGALTLVVFDGKGNITARNSLEGFERNELFLDELKHFLSCMENKRETLVPVREGAQSLRMALAAKQSLATGKPVVLAR